MACSRISPMNDLFRPNRNDAIDRNRLDSPPVPPRDREAAKASHACAPPMGWASVCAWRILCCSPAASRWARGETIRSSRKSWRLQSSSVISCRASVSRRSRRIPPPFRSPCRARRPPSPRRTSMPARPAISPSAMSISAIASRQEICWRSSQYPSSITRFRRTRRRSISSSRRSSRRRPTGIWRR